MSTTCYAVAVLLLSQVVSDAPSRLVVSDQDEELESAPALSAPAFQPPVPSADELAPQQERESRQFSARSNASSDNIRLRSNERLANEPGLRTPSREVAGRNAHRDEAVATTSQLADDLVRQALDVTDDQDLTGRSVRLQDVLMSAFDARERAAAVKAYWRLADAVMQYRFAQDGARRLNSLPGTNHPLSDAQLEAARTDALAAETEARQAVIEAQFGLADLVPASSQEPPLPVDPPLVIAYRTRLDDIYPSGQAPRELRRIDRLLPAVHESLQQRADAVAAAEQAAEALRRGYLDSQVATESLLEGIAQLQRQRRAFLASVRRYNELIADYAMQSVGGVASSDQAVAMLIGRSRASGSLGLERGVQPATANVPVLEGDGGRRIRR